LYFNLKILPQPLNTPGTEIAPGSNIIGIDFKDHGHLLSVLSSSFSFAFQFASPWGE